MDELISKQKAVDLVKDVCDAIISTCECHYDHELEHLVFNDIKEVDAILKCNKEVRDALRNLEGEPEKTGHWIDRQKVYSDLSIATCSCCGMRLAVGRFCPYCGTHMIEAEHD